MVPCSLRVSSLSPMEKKSRNKGPFTGGFLLKISRSKWERETNADEIIPFQSMASWADELDIDDSGILPAAFGCTNSNTLALFPASPLPPPLPLPSPAPSQRHSAASVLQRFQKPLLQEVPAFDDERSVKKSCLRSSPDDAFCRPTLDATIPSQNRKRFFTSPLNVESWERRDRPEGFTDGDEQELSFRPGKSEWEARANEPSPLPVSGNCRLALGKDYSHKRKSKSLTIDNDGFETAAQISKRVAPGMPKDASNNDNGSPCTFPRSHLPAVQTSRIFRENECFHSDSCSTKSHRTSLPYVIPGPAGAFQQGVTGQERSGCNGAANENCKGRTSVLHQADFDTVAWRLAKKYLEKSSTPVLSIGSIKASRTDNRIPKLVAVIKTCTPNGSGDVLVNLKDETDTIAGIVNRRLMGETEFGRLIEPGAVILLRQVAVFSPTPYVHYLNITINNVEQVFHNSQELAFEEFPAAVDGNAALTGSNQAEVIGDQLPAAVDLCTQISTGDRENCLLQDNLEVERISSHIRTSERYRQGQAGSGSPNFVNKSLSPNSRLESICSVSENDYDLLLDDTDIFQCLALRPTII